MPAVIIAVPGRLALPRIIYTDSDLAKFYLGSSARGIITNKQWIARTSRPDRPAIQDAYPHLNQPDK